MELKGDQLYEWSQLGVLIQNWKHLWPDPGPQKCFPHDILAKQPTTATYEI